MVLLQVQVEVLRLWRCCLAYGVDIEGLSIVLALAPTGTEPPPIAPLFHRSSYYHPTITPPSPHHHPTITPPSPHLNVSGGAHWGANDAGAALRNAIPILGRFTLTDPGSEASDVGGVGGGGGGGDGGGDGEGGGVGSAAAELRSRAAAALFLALESATHALSAFPAPVRPKPPSMAMGMGADGVRVMDDLLDGSPPPVPLVGGGGVELPTDLVASSRARLHECAVASLAYILNGGNGGMPPPSTALTAMINFAAAFVTAADHDSARNAIATAMDLTSVGELPVEDLLEVRGVWL